MKLNLMKVLKISQIKIINKTHKMNMKQNLMTTFKILMAMKKYRLITSFNNNNNNQEKKIKVNKKEIKTVLQ